MRRGLVVFLLFNILIITLLVRSTFTLLGLLLDDASEDITAYSKLLLNGTFVDTRPQLIPKIIHQTYVNESVPVRWQLAQQSCKDLHSDYEYKFWTDETSREFVATEYAWFLDTFDGYDYPIQRADAIRYFVLVHFGGVYIDLDNGCNRRLDPLLTHTAWVHRTIPTGISNDAMGAVPRHPFFLRVLESLQHYDRHWFFPYISIMYSTGPLFLSVIWKEWLAANAGKPAEWEGRVSVLTIEAYNEHPLSFFRDYGGSSWHGKDARFILWAGEHWILLTATGFMGAAIGVTCLWLVYARLFSLRYYDRRHGHSARKDQSEVLPSLWRWTGMGTYQLFEYHNGRPIGNDHVGREGD